MISQQYDFSKNSFQQETKVRFRFESFTFGELKIKALNLYIKIILTWIEIIQDVVFNRSPGFVMVLNLKGGESI